MFYAYEVSYSLEIGLVLDADYTLADWEALFDGAV